MYTAAHGTFGAIITVAAWSVAGPAGVVGALPLAFLSHHVLDRFWEHPYGRFLSRQHILWDGVPILMFALAAFLSGIPWVMVSGWIAGNAMDIWDKGRSWIRYGSPFADPGFWHRHNPPKWSMSDGQTKAVAVLAGALPFVILLVLQGAST
ncbi:hypothetical protein [Maritimibacter sp. DP1N21-5]|uniref:hypothetical protein n=1 Tax=Maritimibacter sp. DP1N21-5 TaxID=2836867 RepID=UPI001C4667D5|nr:hypothetical protein [Maritimibacter sp. DP1N21-5]MBV7408779.1 hypothetical protein [Maritimibacter sp. DP1N21-5]